MPRRDPVNGIGIVRDADLVPSQLVPKSYRPGAGGLRRLRQGGDALLQFLGPTDKGVPESLAVGAVEGGKDLAAAGVEDGQALALLPGLGDPTPEGVERADAGDRRAKGGSQPAGGRDADSQTGERARAEPDPDQGDTLPAAGRVGAALDLPEQSDGVLRAAVAGDPQQRLVQDLAVAPGAGGGVGRRGVETDDGLRGGASRT
jgi:hypothetical protein